MIKLLSTIAFIVLLATPALAQEKKIKERPGIMHCTFYDKFFSMSEEFGLNASSKVYNVPTQNMNFVKNYLSVKMKHDLSYIEYSKLIYAKVGVIWITGRGKKLCTFAIVNPSIPQNAEFLKMLLDDKNI